MATIPKGAAVPSDHLKSAAQIEAEGIATVDVVWREHTFTVTADPDDWTVETTLAFEEGKAASGVRLILGPDQWAELLKDKPRNKDLGDLFESIAKALGLGDHAGE